MKKSLIFQWFSALWTGVSTQKQGVASIQKSALFYTFLGADLHKNKGSSTQNLSPYLHKKRGAREPNIHAGVDVSTQILQAEHPFDVIFSKTDVCLPFRQYYKTYTLRSCYFPTPFEQGSEKRPILLFLALQPLYINTCTVILLHIDFV